MSGWGSLLEEEKKEEPKVKPVPKPVPVKDPSVHADRKTTTPKPRPQKKKEITPDRVRLAIMQFIVDHPEDRDVQIAKKNLPKSYGGYRKGGGGWSGAYLNAFKLISKALK